MQSIPLLWLRTCKKNLRGAAPLDTPRGDEIPLDPQQKERPYRNRASKEKKT